jgi:hypothetical protein
LRPAISISSIFGASPRASRIDPAQAAYSAALTASGRRRSASASAARAPRSAVSEVRLKSPALMPSRSGWTRMSVGLSVASDRPTFCSVRILTICTETLRRLPISSALRSGEPTLTAITTSARQRSRASPIGTLSTRPPSTSFCPLISTGDIRPGTDMLARIAEVRLPWRKTTRSP